VGGCGCNKWNKRDTAKFVELPLNERSMLLLSGDDSNCPSYAGAYQGQHFYVAGWGTEHEKLFFRRQRRDAIAYANEHGVELSGLVNSRSFCQHRMLALLGA
jgi:hypothetical protein